MVKRDWKRKFLRDKRGSLEGLPLYILIMVVIAAISLAAILAFMVYASPSIGEIRVKPFLMKGNPNATVILLDLHVGSYYYYRGCNWSELNHIADTKNYADKLELTIYSKGGKVMAGVDIKAEGPNITFAGTTGSNGNLVIPLDGSFGRMMVYSSTDTTTEITITAKHKATIGEDTATRTIQVIAKV